LIRIKKPIYTIEKMTGGELDILLYELCKSEAKVNGLRIKYRDTKFTLMKGNKKIYRTDDLDYLFAFLLGCQYINSKIKKDRKKHNITK